jgi:hypothetical protein
MADVFSIISVLFLGAGIGWAGSFVFVFSATVYKALDGGRAERTVKSVIKSGHGHLAFICLLAAAAAGLAGAYVTACLAAIAAFCAVACVAALAPRTDRPIRGHRVLKTARVTASVLTVGILAILFVAAVFIGVRIT